MTTGSRLLGLLTVSLVLVVISSASPVRVVVENCLNDDRNKVSSWLDARAGRSRSSAALMTMTPCGDASAAISAAAISHGDQATAAKRSLVMVVTFELATSLQPFLARPAAQVTTYVTPDRWQQRRRCPTTSNSMDEDKASGPDIFLLNNTLYPVTSYEDEDLRGCELATWKFHLQSLLRLVKDNADGQQTPITVYLYYADQSSTTTSLSRRPRRSILVGPGASAVYALKKQRYTRSIDWQSSGVVINSKPVQRGNQHFRRRHGHGVSKRFFRIGIIEAPPFMMVKWAGVDNEGVEYYGVLIDILQVLATKLCFNYTLIKYNQYGERHSNGTWSGAIGAVISNDVDLVVADVSITPLRLSVVDYSIPYLQGSQGVVIRRAMEQPSVGDLLRTHLRPFHWTIWLVIFAALLLSTALLTHASRPEDVDHRPSTAAIRAISSRPNPPPPPYVTNPSDLRSSLSADAETKASPPETWWSILFQMLGIFCQQGCALSPNRTSGRIILYTVCLTSLATYNFYTSVFISFTTVTKKPIPVNSLSDVLLDPTYQFGFVQSPLLDEMFKLSDKTTYKRAWRRMQLNPQDVYVTSIEEGINRAFLEKYAFIDEVFGLQWFVGRNCSLKLLQDRMLTEGYHLIFTKHSNDTVLFNRYLKKLQESGMVGRFLQKHMPDVTPDFCTDVNTLEAVGLDRMAGLFICLAAGIVLTSLSVILEKLDSRPIVGGSSKANAGAGIRKVTIKIKKY